MSDGLREKEGRSGKGRGGEKQMVLFGGGSAGLGGKITPVAVPEVKVSPRQRGGIGRQSLKPATKPKRPGGVRKTGELSNDDRDKHTTIRFSKTPGK